MYYIKTILNTSLFTKNNKKQSVDFDRTMYVDSRESSKKNLRKCLQEESISEWRIKEKSYSEPKISNKNNYSKTL